jgi:CRISPR-associated endonuclease/helicase Cas3
MTGNLIPSHLNPTYLNHLMAKSENKGGQTLAQHTWDVLSCLSDLYKLHALTIGDSIFWEYIYWGCFLHDFGKVAKGFQERLMPNFNNLEAEWVKGNHRHEVLSLAFADILFPCGHPGRLSVLAIIGTHHKDIGDIFAKYGRMGRSEDQLNRNVFLLSQVDDASVSLLSQWLVEYGLLWAEHFGIPVSPIAISDAPVNIDALLNALDDLSNWWMDFDDNLASSDEIKASLLLRGLILTADHAASAGIGRFPAMPFTRAHAEKPFVQWGQRAHQSDANKTPLGSAILVAPTGSGKTEASLLWVAQQMEHQPASRLFYTLPYQASMNAMYTRLGVKVLGYSPETLKAGEADGITIQHSRALLKFHQDQMDADERDPRKSQEKAKERKNRSKLNAYPIQVFSPYQMLKVAYSLKGYEALLLDYAHALFIFDEIHAYEPKRLALIIELMRWLREGFGSRFFVMTATLPPMLREKLAYALEPQMINATADEFKRSQRHTVHIHEGRLIDSIVERVQADWANGQTVLVCLNRVADAQKIYIRLRDVLGLEPIEDVILLHGRFNGRDRKLKEDTLLQRVGVEIKRSDRRQFVCVATQVVEVSLNVDFDTLYTDPAPLEALLQRFGRVNRGRSTDSPLLPVHVFTQPSADGKDPYKPYDQLLIQDSLRVLTEYCADRPIDEAQVTEMLGQIYTGATLAAWEKDYRESAETFTRDILGVMKPFQSADKELYAKFYKMFDGIEVLPQGLLDVYMEAQDKRGYLEASQYLVNISYATYSEFDKYGLIGHAKELEGEFFDHIDVTYSDEYGLDIDMARQAAKQQRGGYVTGEEGE